MPRVNYFAIPADDPDRTVEFYREGFAWEFRLGWEYDTPRGREKYWQVITGDKKPGINGGLTRREFPGQPIGVGIEVPAVDGFIARIEKHGGKILVGKNAIPGVGWYAVCQDSEGNTFAMFEPVQPAR